jgi:hypothetical protein
MYQIFKDFAGPVATIIAAFAAVSVTGYFACQQAAIARDKLEHDVFYRLYDRRVAVYEATRKFLADVFHGNITEDDIQAYGLLTLDAQFLFDEELYLYLKEIRQRVAAWRQAKWLSELEPPSAEKGAFADIARDRLDWISQQGDENTGFAVKFRPFLVHRGVSPRIKSGGRLLGATSARRQREQL